MRPLSSIWMMMCQVWVWEITTASAYFVVQQPQANMQWIDNGTNLIQWSKGLGDGITGFDIEMTSKSQDGLLLVAKNVPASPPQLNLMLIDVPPGTDYYLIFMNSTIGVMYATSSQFTILAPSATPSVTPPSLAKNVPTVTLSGASNPTSPFATTFPPLPNGAVVLFTAIQAHGLLLMLLGCAFGAFLALG